MAIMPLEETDVLDIVTNSLLDPLCLATSSQLPDFGHAITQAYDPLLAKDLFFNVLVQAIFTGKPENVRLALAVPEIDVNTIHTTFEF